MAGSLVLQKKRHGQAWVIGDRVGPDHGRPSFALRAPGIIWQFLRSIFGVAVSLVGIQLDTVLGPHSWQFLKGLLTEKSGHGLCWLSGPLPFFWITDRKTYHGEINPQSIHLLPLEWAQSGCPCALPGTMAWQQIEPAPAVESRLTFPPPHLSLVVIFAVRLMLPFLPT